MARPRKDTVDYFSHDKDMRNDPKIKALRNKFGISGYALWCMILETLCDSDNLELKFDDMTYPLLSGDYGVSEAEMEEFISFCYRIDLLQQIEGKIQSKNLKKRLQQVFEKRELLRIKYERKKGTTIVSASETTQEVTFNQDGITQNKVKESKIESKVNNIIDLSNSLFTTEGFEISKQNFNAFNKIGIVVKEFGEEKVAIAIKKAKEVWFHNKKMNSACYWNVLFTYKNINNLYQQSLLKLPDDIDKVKSQRGNNPMPKEFE